MDVEIEREAKYLLRSLPDLTRCDSKDMVDIYIPRKVGHAAVRIRKKGDRFFITKTTEVFEEGSKKSLKEETINITEEDFEVFRTMTGAMVIDKTRYLYPLGGKLMEIDVFHGKHQGLILAEVEFNSIDEMNGFQQPSFYLADVTGHEFLAGGVLYKLSYEDIKDKLAGLGYQELSV